MTGFRLSEEQEEFRGTVRRLAASRVAPNAEAADRDATFPRASWDALVAEGLPSLTIAESYGGQGADLVTWALCVEEIGRACAATAVTMLVHAGASSTLGILGTEAQRREWLPKAASGEWLLGYAQSEAHAGSDVASIRCRAERDGDRWVLNGAKHWITSIGEADAYVVFAKTTPDGAAKGISTFLVEADTPGVTVGKVEDKMGLRGSPTGELLLDNVSVPERALVGPLDRGFVGAMGFLDRSRPVVGAQAIGVAQAAFVAARDYVREREAFGRPVADFQAVQFMLADMQIGLETARSAVWRACAAAEAGDPDATSLSSIAKTHATDAAMQVTTDAVQLLGGAGYVKDFPVERHMRDAKVFQIYEGTNQIQRLIVGRRLLARDDL